MQEQDKTGFASGQLAMTEVLDPARDFAEDLQSKLAERYNAEIKKASQADPAVFKLNER